MSLAQQNCLQEYSEEIFDKTSGSSIAVGSLVQKMVSRIHGFSESMVDDRVSRAAYSVVAHQHLGGHKVLEC